MELILRGPYRQGEGEEGPGASPPGEEGGGGAGPAGGEAREWGALPDWAQAEYRKSTERAAYLEGEARKAFAARDEGVRASRALEERLASVEKRFAPKEPEGPALPEYGKDWDEAARGLAETAEERAYRRATRELDERIAKGVEPTVAELKKWTAARDHADTVARVKGHVQTLSGTDDEPGEFPIIPPVMVASVIGLLDNGQRDEETLLRDTRTALKEISDSITKRFEKSRKESERREAEAARTKLAARKAGTMRGGGVPAPPDKSGPWDASAKARKTRLMGALRSAQHPTGR